MKHKEHYRSCLKNELLVPTELMFMPSFDPVFIAKNLVSSLTSEQKRYILSLVKRQSVTIDGTDFVIGDEDADGCR